MAIHVKSACALRITCTIQAVDRSGLCCCMHSFVSIQWRSDFTYQLPLAIEVGESQRTTLVRNWWMLAQFQTLDWRLSVLRNEMFFSRPRGFEGEIWVENLLYGNSHWLGDKDAILLWLSRKAAFFPLHSWRNLLKRLERKKIIRIRLLIIWTKTKLYETCEVKPKDKYSRLGISIKSWVVRKREEILGIFKLITI